MHRKRMESMEIAAQHRRPPHDFAQRIKAPRTRLGLNQEQFADLFAVSSSTVKLWEKSGLYPAQSDWQRIVLIEAEGIHALQTHSFKRTILRETGTAYDLASPPHAPYLTPSLDFTANADVVRTVLEGERLTYGHLFNPAFATEISLTPVAPFASAPGTLVAQAIMLMRKVVTIYY